jgi:hypothetical protein
LELKKYELFFQYFVQNDLQHEGTEYLQTA